MVTSVAGTKSSFQIAISSVICLHALSQVQKFNTLTNNKLVHCMTPWPSLHFNSSKVSNGDTRFKTSHPVRSRHQQELPMEHLKVQTIDAIVSNHTFVAKEFKKVDNGSFFRAISGKSR